MVIMVLIVSFIIIINHLGVGGLPSHGIGIKKITNMRYADNNHLGVGGLPSIILLCFSASSLLNSCDGVAKWPSCNKEFWYFAILYVLYSCALDICIRCMWSKFLSGVTSFSIVEVDSIKWNLQDTLVISVRSSIHSTKPLFSLSLLPSPSIKPRATHKRNPTHAIHVTTKTDKHNYLMQQLSYHSAYIHVPRRPCSSSLG